MYSNITQTIVIAFILLGAKLFSQPCTNGEPPAPSILGEWNFNSNTVNCNGVVSNRIAQYDLYTPRFGAGFGNLEYCPNTNNGCGQTKLGSKGHVNTNDFYYAICLANFGILLLLLTLADLILMSMIPHGIRNIRQISMYIISFQ